MSDPRPRSAPGPVAAERLLRATQEAREHLGSLEVRRVDWDSMDARLFARLEQEQRLASVRAIGPLRGPLWAAGAAALAAAACFALFVGKTRSSSTLDSPAAAAAVAAPSAGHVVGLLGPGVLLLDGKPAPVGASLALGDEIETRGVSATIDRPGKLTLVLEAGSRARVTHTQGALVLALESGAVEAQVVPVASGEAFAVDIEGTRTAVHGTHLRVARIAGAGSTDAERVEIDLNEGVVVVGPAPREGSTLGTLLTAPAHADFDPAEPSSSLAVGHDPAAVRAPVAIAAASPSAGNAASLLVPAPSHPVEARPSPTGVTAGSVLPPARLPPSASSAVPTPAEPAADPDAATTLAAAVRACLASRPSSENVTVEVHTTLHVELDDAGNARSARFEPPVAPDVNTCAAAVIYRTRWPHGGSAEVSVDFKVKAATP